MERPDFIHDRLSATKALVKFLVDHKGGVECDLQACLEALEHNDSDLAVRHARLVKPWGMGSLTDWCPPDVWPHETREYNSVVLKALVNEWCSLMSRSFAENNVQVTSQVGDLEAKLKPDGYILCPFCRRIFSAASEAVGTVPSI